MNSTATRRATRRSAPPGAPGLVLLPFALGSGLVASLAFPPQRWWPLLFLAVAGFAVVIGLSRRGRSAVGLGLAYGLAFNLTTLSWQSMVQVSSYLGLAAVESVFFALLGGLVYAARGLRTGPFVPAALWVLVEGLQARFPFGGFGWTKLGYAMIDSPLAGLLPLVGSPGVSFVVALVGQGVAWALLGRRATRWLTPLLAMVVAFAAGAAGTLLPVGASSGTLSVGWVQGGASGGGFYGIGEPGETGKNHAAETRRLLARVASGELPRPDFIVWPENGTDADPLLDATANAVLTDSAAAAGVPIVVGTPTSGPARGERQTTAFWWTVHGPTARYDKRNLVPFGEWIPFREILLPLIPILDVIGDQAVPGTEPGVLRVTGPDGAPLSVGVAICYEVAFADTINDAVLHGAEVMIVGSNNAMFQGSPQIDQQFAITRARAAELGRQILVVTTSGVTGLIDEHGRVAMRAPDRVGASGVVTMQRATGRTPLLEGGWLVEPLLTAAGLIGTVVAFGLRRRRGTMGDGTPAPDEERDDG